MIVDTYIQNGPNGGGGSTERLVAAGSLHVAERLVPLVASLRLKHRWEVLDCRHLTPTYVSEGFPLVSTGEVTPGLLDLRRTSRFVGEEDFIHMTGGGRLPTRGDIIYSRNASVGTAAYVDTNEAFCMGQDVVLLRSSSDSGLLLSMFLNHAAHEQIASASVGSTFSRINVAQIRELRIPEIPQDEQSQIADELDTDLRRRQALAEVIRRSAELLVEYRKGLITEAVTGQLDPKRMGESAMEERVAEVVS